MVLTGPYRVTNSHSNYYVVDVNGETVCRIGNNILSQKEIAELLAETLNGKHRDARSR